MPLRARTEQKCDSSRQYQSPRLWEQYASFLRAKKKGGFGTWRHGEGSSTGLRIWDLETPEHVMRVYLKGLCL